MIKTEIAFRILPSDNVKNFGPALIEKLSALCAKDGALLKWHADEDDIIIEEQDVLHYENRTTTDLIDDIEELGKIFTHHNSKILGQAVGWDEDGFIIKVEMDETHRPVFASPNWLLKKSVKEIKNLQRIAK